MRPPLDARRSRVLLARIAEPYDDTVQELVALHGVHDLVGYVLRDGRAPDGTSLERLAARLDRALRLDEEHICAALDARVVVPGDEEWPVCLDDLENPPWCLWARGPVRLHDVPGRSVSVVGARACTAYGEEVTAELCVYLAERGFTIVSGAAFGIDAAAHRAALAVDGVTVGVLAGGVDVPYPRANTDLIARIGQTGALASETPPGGAPARMRFLARNRLIAALTSGTVIVEAGHRSGARTTTKHARELGRHVMAVPGSVHSVMSQGCHGEVRLGAELVTDGAEVAELVGRIGADLAPVKRGEQRDGDDLPPEVHRVWQWLRPRSSASVDELMVRAGMGLSEVLSALTDLEQRGLAEHLLDGWQRRSPR